jgi:hypothetical protein
LLLDDASLTVRVHVTSHVRSKIGQNKADAVANDAFPLKMLNSLLASSERRHRRSVRPAV